MLDRRTKITDAAIAIVGEGGTRSVTHRGVDRRLNLPDGSTSNYFRTRGALLDAAVLRMRELDQATLTDIHSGFENIDDGAIARGLAEFLVRLCRPGRILRTRARFALTLVYPERFIDSRNDWIRLGIDSLGWTHPDPERLSRILLAYVDGVLMQAILESRGEGLELDRAALADVLLGLLRRE